MAEIHIKIKVITQTAVYALRTSIQLLSRTIKCLKQCKEKNPWGITAIHSILLAAWHVTSMISWDGRRIFMLSIIIVIELETHYCIVLCFNHQLIRHDILWNIQEVKRSIVHSLLDFSWDFCATITLSGVSTFCTMWHLTIYIPLSVEQSAESMFDVANWAEINSFSYHVIFNNCTYKSQNI